MEAKLKTKDGAVFTIKFNEQIAEASGLMFRQRKFFFRCLEHGYAVFEEGVMVYVDEDEVKDVTITILAFV